MLAMARAVYRGSQADLTGPQGARGAGRRESSSVAAPVLLTTPAPQATEGRPLQASCLLSDIASGDLNLGRGERTFPEMPVRVVGVAMPGLGFEPRCPYGTAAFKAAASDRFRHPGACACYAPAAVRPVSGLPFSAPCRSPSHWSSERFSAASPSAVCCARALARARPVPRRAPRRRAGARSRRGQAGDGRGDMDERFSARHQGRLGRGPEGERDGVRRPGDGHGSTST